MTCIMDAGREKEMFKRSRIIKNKVKKLETS